MLIELFADGFEERETAGEVELAAYTERTDAVALLAPLGPVTESPVVAGWETAWRGFHRPVRIGPLWLGPPWEAPDDGAAAVVIDPGRAFGTGAHPTTRLCLELMLAVEPNGLVDLGCGSGVLAVAAARLGFRPVIALDADEAAVDSTRANAAANGVEVEARLADVLADALPAVAVAVANIAREPVERAAERFAGALFVGSGYLIVERPAPAGWRIAERRELDGWAADLLERG
ncbi:MAG: 50S ribosomal protein L11 methyltransferase [Gaiellaceae bacterium]